MEIHKEVVEGSSCHTRFVVGDGAKIKFWYDLW